MNVEQLIAKQRRHAGHLSRHNPLVHWVRAAVDGPIQSTGGPALPAEVSSELKQEYIGHPGTYRVACDVRLVLGILHNGTDQTCFVNCPKCMETAEFKESYRPHPRDAAELERIAQLNAMKLEELQAKGG